MSVRLLSAVMEQSKSKLAARLVLFALADAAHDDGVTWSPQEVLARKANLSRGHVVECLKELEASGEVEVRKAQRGRKRINVYRVRFARVAVDYERLPFSLVEPFNDDVRSSDTVTDDHVRKTGSTTSEVLTSRARVISEDLNRNGKRKQTLAGTDLAVVPGDAPERKRRRAQDVAFDAIAEATGADPLVEGGRIAKALALIRQAYERDLTRKLSGKLGDDDAQWQHLADEIQRRAVLYAQRFPGAELTPTALASNWTRVTKGNAGGVSTGGLLRAADELERRSG